MELWIKISPFWGLSAVLEAEVFAFVAMLVIVIAVLFANRFHFEFSCHNMLIIPYLWYNWKWKGGRVVEGTGLENQSWKHPQVRILSFPPHLLRDV